MEQLPRRPCRRVQQLAFAAVVGPAGLRGAGARERGVLRSAGLGGWADGSIGGCEKGVDEGKPSELECGEVGKGGGVEVDAVVTTWSGWAVVWASGGEAGGARLETGKGGDAREEGGADAAEAGGVELGQSLFKIRDRGDARDVVGRCGCGGRR